MGWAMGLRTRTAGLGVLLALLAGDVLAAAADLRSVRLWRAPDNTRLVFDLSGPVQHSVFTLSAPNRIVIDVAGAQLATKLEELSLSNTPITSIRSAQRSPTEAPARPVTLKWAQRTAVSSMLTMPSGGRA